ncbi:hypothetical protein, partial [Burkholderia sp. SIMBA_024]|uniref:hypothetical protein n=1 Tax=Burkholderia sp. SIMBA_024 TaxID=3085768 RepID=UPI00397CCCD0
EHGANASGVASDELRVQSGPGGVEIASMEIAAREARRDAGDDHRADRHLIATDGDGQVRHIVAEVRRQLHRRSAAGDEHHGRAGPGTVLSDR